MAFKDTAKPIISGIAKQYNVDPNVVYAIVEIESAWIPQAVRYEPHYTYLCDIEKNARANKISRETEQRLQMFSFGLMQVMGGLARSLQFQGSLISLFEIGPNVHVGCKFLSQLMKKYDSLEDVVASYNAGSPRRNDDGLYFNQAYVNKFLAHYKSN